MGTTRAEMVARQRKITEWRETEIGRLFERYDAAVGHAWVTDQTSDSPKRSDEAWAKARAAKIEFLDKVCALMEINNPYR